VVEIIDLVFVRMTLVLSLFVILVENFLEKEEEDFFEKEEVFDSRG
jgi:hypothetical protein